MANWPQFEHARATQVVDTSEQGLSEYGVTKTQVNKARARFKKSSKCPVIREIRGKSDALRFACWP